MSFFIDLQSLHHPLHISSGILPDVLAVRLDKIGVVVSAQQCCQYDQTAPGFQASHREALPKILELVPVQAQTLENDAGIPAHRIDR